MHVDETESPQTKATEKPEPDNSQNARDKALSTPSHND